MIVLDVSDLYSLSPDFNSTFFAQVVFNELKKKHEVIAWYSCSDGCELKHPSIKLANATVEEASRIAEKELEEILSKNNIEFQEINDPLTYELPEGIEMILVWDEYGFDIIIFRR